MLPSSSSPSSPAEVGGGNVNREGVARDLVVFNKGGGSGAHELEEGGAGGVAEKQERERRDGRKRAQLSIVLN